MSANWMWVWGLLLSAGCAQPAPSTSAAAPRAANSAAEALDSMDSRTPVPLLPMMANHQKQNMREHLEAVRDIVAALATDDFDAVRQASGRIGYSEQMGRMCSHMGAGAPGFTDQAMLFHRTADRIATAAVERDRGRVLSELAATLRTCTNCHSTWKQRVVDEATWRQSTSSAPPTGHGAGRAGNESAPPSH